MHTNPILLSFCSLLYYRNLQDHIRNYIIEKKSVEDKFNLSDEFIFRIDKFTGRVEISAIERETKTRKNYKKNVVNKWHVMLMLQRNKTLIKYRAHNIIKKENKENH